MAQRSVRAQRLLKNIEKDELVITRVPQRHIQGWQRPVKKK